MRSSSDGMPLGIFVKSSLPIGFCFWKSNGAWSVATVWMRPSRRPFQSTDWLRASRSGGDITYFAPSKFGRSA